MFKKIIYIFFIFLFLSSFAKNSKAHKFFEKDYQKYWCDCHNGTIEYTLPDKTRVDCVIENYAIEFDFAPKWAEAIGQALYYSLILKKSPAVVLICENYKKDCKYIDRIKVVCKKYGITLWFITPEDLNKN